MSNSKQRIYILIQAFLEFLALIHTPDTFQKEGFCWGILYKAMNVWQQLVLCDLIALVFLKNKGHMSQNNIRVWTSSLKDYWKLLSPLYNRRSISVLILQSMFVLTKGSQDLIILYSNEAKISYMVLTSNQTETHAPW